MTEGAAPPGQGEVRVFRVDVPADPGAVAALAAALPGGERAWAERLREGGPRARFVAARAALRRLLAARLGCAPCDVPLRVAPGGKPELADRGAAQTWFSVSHSGALALVAIAAQPLGVDVERLRPLRDPAALAARLFSPAERGIVERDAEPYRARRFLELWTAKEAVLKATGVGLPGIADVALSLGPGGAVSGATAVAARWEIAIFRPAPGHVAAVAARRLPPRIDVLADG